MKHIIGTKAAIVAMALATSVVVPSSVSAQEQYIGEIIMGGWNFCPRGTASTDGQLLSIAQNSALFSLLGTQFGGDGRTTFGLPDLRGRTALHTGNGAGLTPHRVGDKGGSEMNTLTTNQLPSHSHALLGSTEAANTPSPTGGLNATTGRDSSYIAGTADAAMAPAAIGNAGGGQPVNNMQPYQVITYCIVIQGIFPSRS